MIFLIAFAVAWLAVTVTTVTRLLRPRRSRWDVSLLARAGLLIWFPGVIAATFAEVRHRPASQISQTNALEIRCKMAGSAVLLTAGLAGLLRSRRAARAESAARATGTTAPGQP